MRIVAALVLLSVLLVVEAVRNRREDRARLYRLALRGVAAAFGEMAERLAEVMRSVGVTMTEAADAVVLLAEALGRGFWEDGDPQWDAQRSRGDELGELDRVIEEHRERIVAAGRSDADLS